MIKVYGCSDDLVEIEGAPYPYDEVGCFEKNVRIWFSDGTEILVGYPKEEGAIWWINRIKQGDADQGMLFCHDEDASPEPVSLMERTAFTLSELERSLKKTLSVLE